MNKKASKHQNESSHPNMDCNIPMLYKKEAKSRSSNALPEQTNSSSTRNGEKKLTKIRNCWGDPRKEPISSKVHGNKPK